MQHIIQMNVRICKNSGLGYYSVRRDLKRLFIIPRRNESSSVVSNFIFPISGPCLLELALFEGQSGFFMMYWPGLLLGVLHDLFVVMLNNTWSLFNPWDLRFSRSIYFIHKVTYCFCEPPFLVPFLLFTLVEEKFSTFSKNV